MATREYQFIVGPETSTLPTVGTPSVDTDILTLGYADDRYTQGSEAVADVTALKAIAASERRDGDYVLVKSTNNVYRFDSASALTGDDNFVATPSAGTGRWIRVTILNRQNTFTDTTQSTSKDTGSAIFEGGVGIEKNLYVGGNINVTGDLTVDGTTTTLNTQTLDVEDANITVNKNGTVASANAAVSGITVDTDVTDARVGYDSSLASRFKAGDVGSESEVMTVGTVQTVSGIKTFSDNVVIDNAKKLVFEELNASGNNYVSLKAPDSLSSNVEFTLPSADGTFEQVLATNASGQLSFITVPTTTLNQYHVKVGNASNVETPVNTNTTGDISADSTNGLNIKTGVIVNADVNATAGIQFSKLESLTSGQVLIGDGSNIATPRTISGDLTVDNTGLAAIASGVIVNADVNASAGIQFSKLESLTSARIVVGNVSNVPTAVDVTGDVTINNTGVTAISSGVIVNADINASAAIDGSKIVSATDSVSGVVTTTTQSFAGAKKFKEDLEIEKSGGNLTLNLDSGSGYNNIYFNNAGVARASVGVSETAGTLLSGSSAQDLNLVVDGGGRKINFGHNATTISGQLNGSGGWVFGASGGTQTHTFEGKAIIDSNGGNQALSVSSAGVAANSDTMVQINGIDNTSSNYALTVNSNSNGPIAKCRNDGRTIFTDGIQLKSSGSGSSHLNWYEEGTSTLTFINSGFVLINYDYNTLHFTRIGNVVNFRGRIKVGNTTGSGNSNQQQISGLPYTIGQEGQTTISYANGVTTTASAGWCMTLRSPAGGVVLYPYDQDNVVGGATPLNSGITQSVTEYVFAGFYFV